MFSSPGRYRPFSVAVGGRAADYGRGGRSPGRVCDSAWVGGWGSRPYHPARVRVCARASAAHSAWLSHLQRKHSASQSPGPLTSGRCTADRRSLSPSGLAGQLGLPLAYPRSSDRSPPRRYHGAELSRTDRGANPTPSAAVAMPARPRAEALIGAASTLGSLDPFGGIVLTRCTSRYRLSQMSLPSPPTYRGTASQGRDLARAERR